MQLRLLLNAYRSDIRFLSINVDLIFFLLMILAQWWCDPEPEPESELEVELPLLVSATDATGA
jgi:hypothetical protein